MSFYGNYFLTTSYAADHIKNKLGPQNIKITSSDLTLKTRSDIFYSGLHNAIDILEKNQKKVILTVDIPELPFFPRDCYRNDKNCQLMKNEVKSRQLELRALIAKLKQQHPSLLIFDPIQIFCPNELCIFQDSKQILYRDSHHLTLRGSDIYAKYFINWLNIH